MRILSAPIWFSLVFLPLSAFIIQRKSRSGSVRCHKSSGNSDPTNKMFIFGLGYVGTFVARTFQRSGWHVSGTSRSSVVTTFLRTEGIQAFPCTVPEQSDEAVRATVSECTHVLSCIPPGPEQSYDAMLKRFGSAMIQSSRAGTLQWIGYLSTTGVYGDQNNGAWVDENTPISTTSRKARERATAERQWLMLHEQFDCPVHILRLAGIYGPSRSIVDTLMQMPPPVHAYAVDDAQYTSRIHVTDIVTSLRASMQQPSPGSTYNLADDRPATRYEVLVEACRLLGRPIPPSVDVGASSPTRGGSKRVRNDKLQALLRSAQKSLSYPDYTRGLVSLVPPALLAASGAGITTDGKK